MLQRLRLYLSARLGRTPGKDLEASGFGEEKSGPLFLSVKSTDPEFRRAVHCAQASLPTFRELLSRPEFRPPGSAFKMVKTKIVEGENSAWIWLMVDCDESVSFKATLFEVPQEFETVKPGTTFTVADEDIADWALIDKACTLHGGFSLRLQRLRRPESERDSYDAYIGVKHYAPLPQS